MCGGLAGTDSLTVSGRSDLTCGGGFHSSSPGLLRGLPLGFPLPAGVLVTE